MNKELSAPSLYSSEIISSNKLEKKRPNYMLRRIGSVILAGFIFTGIGAGANQLIKNIPPESLDDVYDYLNNDVFYSEDADSFRVEQGNTVWGMVREHVEGIDTVDGRAVDYYVKHMPENADVFADGILNEGEDLELPNQVSRYRSKLKP